MNSGTAYNVYVSVSEAVVGQSSDFTHYIITDLKDKWSANLLW